MGPIRKFLELPSNERVLLVVAVVLFGAFSVLLRVGSFERSEAVARWLAGAGLARWSVESVDWALSVLESTVATSGGCLPAALVGLAITDERLELRFGVREGEASIEAHAWLRCADGRLLYAGADPAEFRRLE